MEQAPHTYPAEIVFNNFRPQQIYEVKLKIYFQHSRPHKLRLEGPDQQHFSVLKPWHRNILCRNTAKYRVLFKPKEDKNYFCSLTYKVGKQTYYVPISGFQQVPVLDLTEDTNKIQLDGCVSGPAEHLRETALTVDKHICESYTHFQHLSFWSPKVMLSHDIVTVGNIVMEYQHTYELTLSNWGLSQAPFRLVPSHSTRAQHFTICASEDTVPPGQEQQISVTFCAQTPGCFEERLFLEVEGMLDTPCVTFRGRVMDNPFAIDVPHLDFGDVCEGSYTCRTFNMSNRCAVPLKYGIRILGSVHTPSFRDETQQEDDVFSLIPPEGTINAGETRKMMVTLCCPPVGKHKRLLAFHYALAGGDMGEQVTSLQVTAKCIRPKGQRSRARASHITQRVKLHRTSKVYVYKEIGTMPARFASDPEIEGSNHSGRVASDPGNEGSNHSGRVAFDPGNEGSNHSGRVASDPGNEGSNHSGRVASDPGNEGSNHSGRVASDPGNEGSNHSGRVASDLEVIEESDASAGDDSGVTEWSNVSTRDGSDPEDLIVRGEGVTPRIWLDLPQHLATAIRPCAISNHLGDYRLSLAGAYEAFPQFKGLLTPKYLLDFGYVIPGDVSTVRVTVWNTEEISASFSLWSTLASELGFSFGGFRAELEPFHYQTFEVTFDPAAAHLECGDVDIVVRIKVKNGAAVPVRLRATVGMPSRTVSPNGVAVTPCPLAKI